MFTGGTFTVVPVTNDDPWDALGLVVTSDGWNSTKFTSGEVLDAIGLVVLGINGTNQHVVGDVVKMTTVLQPWASHYIR